jgi:mediator of RNA polymerase II transcription subunit 14
LLFQVYSQFQVTLKIPKSVLYGSDFMVMGFPQCANAYYLLIQLDNDLKPVFHLLETRIDGSNKSNAVATTGAKEAIRFNRIDISRMQIGENECHVNLFDAEKSLRNMVNYNQNHEGRQLRQSRNGELLSLVPSFSHFLSAVDEIFGDDERSSIVETQFLPQNLSLTQLSSVQVDHEGVGGTAGLPELDRSFVRSDMNPMELTRGVFMKSNQLSNLSYVDDTNAVSSSGPQVVSSLDCKSSHNLSSQRSPGGCGIVDGTKRTLFIPSDGQRGGSTIYNFNIFLLILYSLISILLYHSM